MSTKSIILARILYGFPPKTQWVCGIHAEGGDSRKNEYDEGDVLVLHCMPIYHNDPFFHHSAFDEEGKAYFLWRMARLIHEQDESDTIFSISLKDILPAGASIKDLLDSFAFVLEEETEVTVTIRFDFKTFEDEVQPSDLSGEAPLRYLERLKRNDPSPDNWFANGVAQDIRTLPSRLVLWIPDETARWIKIEWTDARRLSEIAATLLNECLDEFTSATTKSGESLLEQHKKAIYPTINDKYRVAQAQAEEDFKKKATEGERLGGPEIPPVVLSSKEYYPHLDNASLVTFLIGLEQKCTIYISYIRVPFSNKPYYEIEFFIDVPFLGEASNFLLHRPDFQAIVKPEERHGRTDTVRITASLSYHRETNEFSNKTQTGIRRLPLTDHDFIVFMQKISQTPNQHVPHAEISPLLDYQSGDEKKQNRYIGQLKARIMRMLVNNFRMEQSDAKAVFSLKNKSATLVTL